LLDDAEPAPPRRKHKGKTDRGIFRRAAALIRFVAGKLAPGAFRVAANAATAPAGMLPDEYGEAPPFYQALDQANPYWDCSLDSDTGADFGVGSDGPSFGL
jgi:hypothetical protein